MTDVNIPLLRKAVEWVEEQAALPEIDCQWNQARWTTPPSIRAGDLIYQVEGDVSHTALKQIVNHCGTAYCVAGYIGQMLDERFVDEDRIFDETTGSFIHVADFAAEALGINGGEASLLFDALNGPADVRNVAESIAGEKL